MTQQMESTVTGMFDQAANTFGDVFKSGVKWQDDINKWWRQAIDAAGPALDWQERSQVLVKQALPAAQKNAEEWWKLVEKSYNSSMSLVKKLLEAERDQIANPSAMSAKAREIWEGSLQIMRENAQGIAQANMKSTELWSDFVKNLAGNGVAQH
jgi:hypothetical protein